MLRGEEGCTRGCDLPLPWPVPTVLEHQPFVHLNFSCPENNSGSYTPKHAALSLPSHAEVKLQYCCVSPKAFDRLATCAPSSMKKKSCFLPFQKITCYTFRVRAQHTSEQASVGENMKRSHHAVMVSKLRHSNSSNLPSMVPALPLAYGAPRLRRWHARCDRPPRSAPIVLGFPFLPSANPLLCTCHVCRTNKPGSSCHLLRARSGILYTSVYNAGCASEVASSNSC